MAHTLFIDGAEGTTGLQIYERLEQDPGITLLRLDEADRKRLPRRLEAIAAADLTVLCLPDAAAAEVAAAAPKSAKLCDASTAHRTLWDYGFPELGGRRRRIASSARVAVPGCHASGFLALAAPLVEKGLLPASAPLSFHSLTGYSGGGKKMIAQYQDPARDSTLASPRPYALGLSHKHLPEIQHVAQLAAPPLFVPVLADYYSGMVVSLPLPAEWLAPGWQSRARLAEFYRDYYAGEPLFSIYEEPPADGSLAANALAGRDDIQLFILGNDEQLLLAARYDNLGKGASGAAVQCLNLMLGRPETAGLKIG